MPSSFALSAAHSSASHAPLPRSGRPPETHPMRNNLPPLPHSLLAHRVAAERVECVCDGDVRYDPVKSLWFIAMATGAVIGGIATFTWTAFAVFLVSTGCVLLFGHSLGSHRKLVHDSYQCPKWLE